jgi:hypothetical protein
VTEKNLIRIVEHYKNNIIYETKQTSLTHSENSQNIEVSKIELGGTIKNLKFIKLSLSIGTIIYLSMFMISVLFAILFGSSNYTIWTTTLTDLSSYLVTPTPYRFDFAAILAGVVITVFLIIFTQKVLSNIQKLKHIALKSRICCGLTRVGVIIGIGGSIGSVLVGIFSAERAGPNGIFHNSSAILTFGGITFSIFILSIVIIIFRTGIPKKFGVIGVFGPLIALIEYAITIHPLSEWILLITILISLVPLKFWILHS